MRDVRRPGRSPVSGVGALYGPVWRPFGLRALRAVRVAALLDTDGGPRLPPGGVLGGGFRVAWPSRGPGGNKDRLLSEGTAGGAPWPRPPPTP